MESQREPDFNVCIGKSRSTWDFIIFGTTHETFKNCPNIIKESDQPPFVFVNFDKIVGSITTLSPATCEVQHTNRRFNSIYVCFQISNDYAHNNLAKMGFDPKTVATFLFLDLKSLMQVLISFISLVNSTAWS